MKKLFFVLLLVFTTTTSSFSQESGRRSSETRRIAVSDSTKTEKKTKSRFTIGGGGFLRTGSRADMPVGGYTIELEAQKYYSQDWGVGLLLNYSAQIGSTKHNIGINNYKIKGKHYSFYGGPSVLKSFRNEQGGIYIGAGVGMVLYTADEKVLFGQHVGLAGDIRLSKSVSIGLKASGMFSTTKLDNGRYMSNALLTLFLAFGSL